MDASFDHDMNGLLNTGPDDGLGYDLNDDATKDMGMPMMSNVPFSTISTNSFQLTNGDEFLSGGDSGTKPVPAPPDTPPNPPKKKEKEKTSAAKKPRIGKKAKAAAMNNAMPWVNPNLSPSFSPSMPPGFMPAPQRGRGKGKPGKGKRGKMGHPMDDMMPPGLMPPHGPPMPGNGPWNGDMPGDGQFMMMPPRNGMQVR
eukprot:508365-Rhodomonas_salina.2